MKLKKGDTVKVLAGKDKGRTGKIERVYIKQDKVLVPQVNMYKKHAKKSESLPSGGVVELPRFIHVSKVALICKKCHKLTRVGLKRINNKKIRICKKCGQEI